MPAVAEKAAEQVVRRCLQDALTPGLHSDAWSGLDSSGLDSSGLDEAATAALTGLAIAHGVEGWVRRRAEAVGVSIPALTTAVHAALARHQRAVSDLQMVTEALTSIGRAFLVVKGPALVAQFYSGAELRSSVDLDVLVRPEDVADVLQALERAGCTLLDANWPLLTQLCVHELRVQGPSAGIIDLHWSLGSQPSDSAPIAATLIARGQDIVIAGQPVRTLDWADTVVHLAVHAADSGADRLIWYADLHGALAAAPPGGEVAVAQRASEWGAGPALQLMLLRSHRAIGLHPPDALLDALAERGPGLAWSGLIRAVDRLAPVGAAPGRPSVGRIVARSARRNAAASWGALCTKSARTVLPGKGPDPNQLRDPGDPRSGLFPSGGPTGREDFLNRLTAGGTSTQGILGQREGGA